MIKRLTILLCCFIVLLIASSSIAQSCGEKITAIYFGNGVGNSFAQAWISRNGLRSAYLVKHDIREDYPDEKFLFDVAYNPTREPILDILEVIDQKVIETGGPTALQMLNLMQLGRGTAAMLIKEFLISSNSEEDFSSAVEAIDAASYEYIEYLKSEAGSDRHLREKTEDSHKDKYLADLIQGRRVLVIAHSQGNLFANDAVQEVIAEDYDRFKDSIGIIGVANPAGVLLNNHNEYITADDDWVISALSITHSVLEPTIDNDPGIWNDYRDRANHGFMESYLASELKTDYATGENTLRSRKEIDTMVLRFLSELKFPSCEEKIPVVNSVFPEIATLNVPTLFTVSGENLPSTLEFSLEDCLDVTPSWVSSETERKFTCTPSYSTGLKGLTISESPDGDFLYGRYIKFVNEGNNTPIVNSVSPLNATLNESAIFTVSGQNLTSTLAFWIGECEDLTPLGGTSSSMQFRCTPSWTTGLKDGLVKDEQGGTTLYSFQVNVSDEPPVVVLPVVNSVTPNEAVLDEPTIFTVNGKNLPSTLAFWIDECANVEKVGGDSSTSMMFRCLPSWTAGRKDGVIKDEQGGTTLYSFQVNIVDDNEPVVNSVSPAAVTLGVSTDFTVTGQNLPSTLAFFIEECADLQSLGGSSTYMQFRCTPSYTLGSKNGVVKDQPGGTVLKGFTVDVADAPADDEIILGGVQVNGNQDLYENSTARYTAEACFFNRADIDDPSTELDEANTYTKEACFSEQDDIRDVTAECTWQAYPTKYVTSLGGGQVEALPGSSGATAKVICKYYHSPSNRNFSGTLEVTVK